LALVLIPSKTFRPFRGGLGSAASTQTHLAADSGAKKAVRGISSTSNVSGSCLEAFYIKEGGKRKRILVIVSTLIIRKLIK